MYICILAYIHTSTHTCIHTYIHTHTHIHAYIRIYRHIHVCVCVCVCVCIPNSCRNWDSRANRGAGGGVDGVNEKKSHLTFCLQMCVLRQVLNSSYRVKWLIRYVLLGLGNYWHPTVTGITSAALQDNHEFQKKYYHYNKIHKSNKMTRYRSVEIYAYKN
jgi:hypothetical protein